METEITYLGIIQDFSLFALSILCLAFIIFEIWLLLEVFSWAFNRIFERVFTKNAKKNQNDLLVFDDLPYHKHPNNLIVLSNFWKIKTDYSLAFNWYRLDFIPQDDKIVKFSVTLPEQDALNFINYFCKTNNITQQDYERAKGLL